MIDFFFGSVFFDLLTLLNTGVILYVIKQTRPKTTPLPLPSLQPKLIPVVTGIGPEKVYIRFHFNDGRIEVKKFLATALSLQLNYRDRLFEAGSWTEDGHIYNEVV